MLVYDPKLTAKYPASSRCTLLQERQRKHGEAAKRWLKRETKPPVTAEDALKLKKETVLRQMEELFEAEAAGGLATSSAGPSTSSSSAPPPKAKAEAAPGASFSKACSPCAPPKPSWTKKKKKGGVKRIGERIKRLKNDPEHAAQVWHDRYMRAKSSKKRKKRKKEKLAYMTVFDDV
jgi:hypothetical protein